MKRKREHFQKHNQKYDHYLFPIFIRDTENSDRKEKDQKANGGKKNDKQLVFSFWGMDDHIITSFFPGDGSVSEALVPQGLHS